MEARTLLCDDRACPICYPQNEERFVGRVFAERLRLVGRDRQPASNVPYVISLGDGGELSGTTDSDGRTARITTSKPTSIVSITVKPPSSMSSAGCCNAMSQDLSSESLCVEPETELIAATDSAEVRSSVVDVPLPKGDVRALTMRETSMARSVFGRGVRYHEVRVHHGGWWLFMGMQDSHTAVTPNGEMYYPSAIYQDDFSSPFIKSTWRALFMHEMVHVWQYQMGYAVKRHGLTITSRGRSAYFYRLIEDSRLSDFNMEQQGNIMSDYYMICILGDRFGAFNPGMNPDLLRKIMAPFIENPLDRTHLPA